MMLLIAARVWLTRHGGLPVVVGIQIRTKRWCNPPRIGSGRMLPIAWTDLVSGESLANARCVRVPL